MLVEWFYRVDRRVKQECTQVNPQGIFSGIFSTLTGVDTAALATQATETENAIVAAVEVIIFFLAIITIELFVIMGHTKK